MLALKRQLSQVKEQSADGQRHSYRVIDKLKLGNERFLWIFVVYINEDSQIFCSKERCPTFLMYEIVGCNGYTESAIFSTLL